MPKPVYAIVGTDVFLQLEALREVMAQMPSDVQRVDVDGESAQLADVLDEVRSYSMFGGQKCVVMRSADDFISKNREKLEDFLSEASDGASLVLRCDSLPKTTRVAKVIDKKGQIIACEVPKLMEVPGWIMRRAKQAHRLTVEPDAAQVMADLIGADLGRCDSELSKLALQVEGGVVKAKDVSGTVVYQREQEMWEMTDALTLGRADEAVKRWRHLVSSDPSTEFRAVTWLGLWLEKAVKALAMKRQKMNGFTIARELKIWPAANADKLLVTCEKLGEPGLRSAVRRLLDVDRKNKSGLGDPASNVELFLLSLGQTR
jgi:DNA polymerase III subunit delta